MSKPIIALLYDFDKTLCTTDMEDYAFIPALGYTPEEFWRKANTFGRENRMDGLLAYMYTMIGFMLTTVGIASFFVRRHTNFIMITGPIAIQTS